MKGYRQSSFDPSAYEQPGPPLRPFNWVQWAGVAIEVVGVAGWLLWLAGAMGLTPEWIRSPLIFILLGTSGGFLINSRRGPATEVGREALARQRTWLIITGFSLAAIAAALVILFKGA